MPESFEYVDYHKSLTNELHAIKNRIRSLVRYYREDGENTYSHWLTDGEWKEAALRTVLRRHLPNNVNVGRGFILFQDSSSTQNDILILKPNKPTIFRDGELLIATPDAPGAIIEVKTRLAASDISSVVEKICDIGRQCNRLVKKSPWLGLFVYEGDQVDSEMLLTAACEAYRSTGIPINCISYGRSTFVRYWPIGHSEPGDTPTEKRRASWRSYDLKDVAPAYFIGNVVDSICTVDNQFSDYAWFTYRDGKRPHMNGERLVTDCKA